MSLKKFRDHFFDCIKITVRGMSHCRLEHKLPVACQPGFDCEGCGFMDAADNSLQGEGKRPGRDWQRAVAAESASHFDNRVFRQVRHRALVSYIYDFKPAGVIRDIV